MRTLPLSLLVTTTFAATLNMANKSNITDADYSRPKLKLWDNIHCSGKPIVDIIPTENKCYSIAAEVRGMWFSNGRVPEYHPKYFSRPACNMQFFVDHLRESGKSDQKCINVDTYFQNSVLKLDPGSYGRINSISWNMYE